MQVLKLVAVRPGWLSRVARPCRKAESGERVVTIRIKRPNTPKCKGRLARNDELHNKSDYGKVKMLLPFKFGVQMKNSRQQFAVRWKFGEHVTPHGLSKWHKDSADRYMSKSGSCNPTQPMCEVKWEEGDWHQGHTDIGDVTVTGPDGKDLDLGKLTVPWEDGVENADLPTIVRPATPSEQSAWANLLQAFS